MRWLHISDIHDQPGRDGWSTENLRNGLLEYLKREEICADEIFVTGDYRHAGEQPGEEESVARDAVRFLIEIARQVIPKPKRCEIDDPPEKHIHIVPGNHDLKR
ncbi:MAG: metallophosphoesterase, partial [Clostridiales Family XIII bacterium]|nr:metallophosphoesterase [Clostridiales Family XIII bacterium]